MQGIQNGRGIVVQPSREDDHLCTDAHRGSNHMETDVPITSMGCLECSLSVTWQHSAAQSKPSFTSYIWFACTPGCKSGISHQTGTTQLCTATW